MSAVALLDAGASDGLYDYEFTNVPPGEYLLVSGSDNDNDLFICDAGESCGAYPDLASAQSIVVGSSDVSARITTSKASR